MSWTAGFTTLTYERNLKPGASIEARLGIIGAGRNEEINTNQKTNQRGAYIGFGYKFYNKPDYYTSRQHYGHLLKGGYIRPEINFGSYGVDYILYTGSSIPSKKRLTKTYGSLMVCVGKQWIFDNKFALDVFFGLGTGFTSSNKSQFTTGSGFIDVVDNSTTRYGNNIFPNNLAFNFGLNIGFLGK